MTVSEMTHWSTQIADTFEQCGPTLPLLKPMDQRLESLVNAIRKESTSLGYHKLVSFCILCIHNRDVTRHLINRKVEYANDFQWVMQLRYEWISPTSARSVFECKLLMLSEALKYDFQYVGNPGRLVITPLTDRCRLIFFHAFAQSCGVHVNGCSGVGKTETAKDFANMAATTCVVLHCSTLMHAPEIQNLFMGSAACGAMLCLDNFNILRPEVLSVISEYVATVHTGLRAGLNKISLGGCEVTLRHCTTLIAITNYFDGDARAVNGRSELPSKLKTRLRPCAMSVPDYTVIAEIFFFTRGFTKSTMLARKIVAANTAIADLLPLHTHYSFGLHHFKRLLVMCDERRFKRGESNDCEEALVAQVFCDIHETKLSSASVKILRSVISDIFPAVSMDAREHDNTEKLDSFEEALRCAITKATEQMGFLPTAAHVRKTVQLFSMMAVQYGVGIVGMMCAGKTVLWKTLAKSFDTLDRKHHTSSSHDMVASPLGSVFHVDSTENASPDNLLENTPPATSAEHPLPDNHTKHASPDKPKEHACSGKPTENASLSKYAEPSALADPAETIKPAATNPLPISIHLINPKSMSLTHLFGEFDKNVDKWCDGILARCVRNSTREEPARHQRTWIVFDGIVDSAWAEDVHPMVGDKRVLYLANGEILQLPPDLRILFECSDLRPCAPSFVARVGVLFLDHSAHFSWSNAVDVTLDALLSKYCENEEPQVAANVKQSCVECFEMSFLTTIDFVQQHSAQAPAVTNEINFPLWLSQSILNILEPIMFATCVMPPTARDRIVVSYLFALLSTVGQLLPDALARKAFSNFLIKWTSDDNKLDFLVSFYGLTKKPPAIATMGWFEFLPELNSTQTLFDFVPDEMFAWKSWSSVVNELDVQRYSQFHSIVVSTEQTERIKHAMGRLLPYSAPIIFAGPTCTGKSMIINQVLRTHAGVDLAHASFCMTPYQSGSETQKVIDISLSKRLHKVYGPPHGKRLCLFVDDINMPLPEQGSNSQQALELIRELIGGGGWYHHAAKEFRQILDIFFIGAMGLPRETNQTIPARLLRFMLYISLVSYNRDQVVWIFSNTTKCFLSQYAQKVRDSAHKIVMASIHVHDDVREALKRSPTKCHYVFTLRDLTRVLVGVLSVTRDAMTTGDDVLRAWTHEAMRVYLDRASTSEDSHAVMHAIKSSMSEFFKRIYTQLIKVEPLIYTSIMPITGKNGKISFKYQDVQDPASLLKFLVRAVEEYNATAKVQLTVVMFTKFTEMVCRIARVLRFSHSNALIVGAGGLGKRTCAILAGYCSKYRLMKVEMSKTYALAEWHEDLKRALFLSGCSATRGMVLFTDSPQSTRAAASLQDKIVADIVELVNTGVIPSLLNNDDVAHVLELCTKHLNKLAENAPAHRTNDDDGDGSGAGSFRGVLGSEVRGEVLELANAGSSARTTETLMNMFVDEIRTHLHVVYLASPLGSHLRVRLREYPALAKACTIMWFSAWPMDALRTVATQFLEPHFDSEADAKVLEKVVQCCAHMHESAGKFASKGNKSFFYVTPNVYLDFLRLVCKKLPVKRESTSERRRLFEAAGDKMGPLKKAIVTLEGHVEKIEPFIEVCEQEHVVLLGQKDKAKKQLAITSQNFSSEEKQAIASEEAANMCRVQIKNAIESATSAMEPVLIQLAKLDKNEISEFKALKNPPMGVHLLAEVLCLLFKIKPSKKSHLDQVQKVLTVDWVKKIAEFHEQKVVQRDGIPQSVVKKICDWEEDAALESNAIKEVSVCAHVLVEWVRALYQYHLSLIAIIDMKENLTDAESTENYVSQRVQAKKSVLDKEIEDLNQIETQLTDCDAKHRSLKESIEELTSKIDMSKRILACFGLDATKWKDKSRKLALDLQNVIGDVIVACGNISYLGPFTASQRGEESAAWVQYLKKNRITTSEKVSLRNAFGDALLILRHVNNDLPDDVAFAENTIMMECSCRVPLCVDPHRIAIRWLKRTSPKLKTVRLTDHDYIRHLEVAIQYGHAMHIEWITETLDAVLEPLLRKTTFRAGTMDMIRIGDSTIEFNLSFSMCMTTTLSNPHYASDVYSMCNVVNFTPTTESLMTQLLSRIVQRDNPEVERKRLEVRAEGLQTSAQMETIEEDILRILVSNSSIEEDQWNALNNKKQSLLRLEDRASAQERVSQELDEARAFYAKVARRSTPLFTVLMQLALVHDSYAYSLDWFLRLFNEAIGTAPKARGQQRINNFSDTFLRLLYENVAMGLFGHDKILFELSLALKVLEEDDRVHPDFPRIFVAILRRGANANIVDIVSSEPQSPRGNSEFLPSPKEPTPKPDSYTLDVSDHMWKQIQSLDALGQYSSTFQNFSASVASDQSGWNKLMEWGKPLEEQELRTPTDCTPIDSAIIKSVLFPNHFDFANDVRQIIAFALGAEFLDPPIVHFEKIVSRAAPLVPVVVIDVDGEDPVPLICKLAASNGRQNACIITLDSSSKQCMLNALETASTNGSWVILEIGRSTTADFMPAVELFYETLSDSESPHADFRLWFACHPRSAIPTVVFSNAYKVALERPTGLRNHLQHIYQTYISNQDQFDAICQSNLQRRELAFYLSILHVSCCERVRLGLWATTAYAFSGADWNHCATLIADHITEIERQHGAALCWNTIQFYVTDIVYGAHMVDPHDWNMLGYLTRDLIAHSPQGYVTASKLGQALRNRTQFTLAEQQELVRLDTGCRENPDKLGMHQFAYTPYHLDMADHVLTMLYHIQHPADAARGHCDDGRQWVSVHDLFERFREAKYLPIERATEIFSCCQSDPLNAVLLQELAFLNNLYRVMLTSLTVLNDCAVEHNAVPADLENMLQRLNVGRVPELWLSVSYCTKYNLARFVDDFFARRDFFTEQWIRKERAPLAELRIAAFAFPKAVLTAIKQKFCRDTAHPLEDCRLDVQILQEFKTQEFDLLKTVCVMYGIFLEGADWKDMALATFPQKIMHNHKIGSKGVVTMPPILITPTHLKELKADSCYMCPLYKLRMAPTWRTSSRCSVHNTQNGMITYESNFIMQIPLPLPPNSDESLWILKGVMLVTQTD